MTSSRVAGVVVGVGVLFAACGDAEPRDEGAGAATPAPSVFLEDRERPKVEKAFEDLSAAIAAEDWPAALALMTDDSLDYFAELRRVTAVGGPEAVAELDTFGSLAVAVVRASEGLERVSDLSEEEFLAALAENDVLGTDGDIRLQLEGVRVLGDRAQMLVPQPGSARGAAWIVTWELDGEQWKVDLADVARIAGDVVEDTAKKAGHDVEALVLRAAASLVGEPVTRAIWDKP